MDPSGTDSLLSVIAHNGPWALVALLELQVIRVLWKRYDEIQELRINEKATVVKALTESAELSERVAELVAQRKGG